MRLIDADKIADYICDKCGADNCDRNPTRCIERDFAMACAKGMPEAVVRCKDCFHFWDGVCKAHIDVIYVDDNDFCSMGERKDEID